MGTFLGTKATREWAERGICFPSQVREEGHCQVYTSGSDGVWSMGAILPNYTSLCPYRTTGWGVKLSLLTRHSLNLVLPGSHSDLKFLFWPLSIEIVFHQSVVVRRKPWKFHQLNYHNMPQWPAGVSPETLIIQRTKNTGTKKFPKLPAAEEKSLKTDCMVHPSCCLLVHCWQQNWSLAQ